ncbi:MAG: hypothetical protein RLZZ241_2510 [Bacteroidota bacterium]
MRHFLLLGATVLLTACQDQKIAFVDYSEVMNQYEAKKELEGQFQQRAQRFARKRDSISQVFQYEAQQFQQRAQRMSETSAQEEYNDLQSRGSAIGQQLQIEEQGIQEQGQNKMDSLIKHVRTRIAAYGEQMGYTYVLAGGEGGTVLYGKTSEDITTQVITFLNEEIK